MAKSRLIGTVFALAMAVLLAGCAATGSSGSEAAARHCGGSVTVCSR